MTTAAAEPLTAPTLVWLDPNTLDVHPDNPRTEIGDVTDLAATIVAHGQQSPIAIAPLDTPDGDLVVLWGQRRLAACREAGVQVLAMHRPDLTDRAAAIEAMVIENVHRQDMTTVDEARAFQRLIDLGLTQEQVAERCHRSQAHVSKGLALLALSNDALDLLTAGRITKAQAMDMVKLTKNKTELARVTKTIEDRGEQANPYATQDLIDRAVKKVEDAEKVKTTTAALKKKGVTLFKRAAGGSWQGDYYWANETARPLGGQDGRLHPVLSTVTVKAHATEPCHAASVTPEGKTVWVCTDPEKHEPKLPAGKSRAKAKSKADPEADGRVKLHAELLEAQAARRGFVATLAGEDPTKYSDFTNYVHALVAAGDYDNWPFSEEYLTSLTGHSLLSIAIEDPARALFVSALAIADYALDDDPSPTDRPEESWWRAPDCHPTVLSESYLALLTSIGYTPTVREQAFAAGPECRGTEHKRGAKWSEHRWSFGSCDPADRPTEGDQ